jgi:hypothetical protein
MADIRIKDLGTTASVTASDDFMAVDGTTNGTRKLSAATPSFATSVTVPGVSAPAATALTLAGGNTGASLVLGQGTTAADVTLTAKGTGSINLDAGAVTARSVYVNSTSTLGPAFEFRKSGAILGIIGSSAQIIGGATTHLGLFAISSIRFWTNNSGTEVAQFSTGGNLLLGTTTDITGTGGLHVAGTSTASTTTSGALRVGSNVGLSGNAGGPSYFGGSLTTLSSSVVAGSGGAARFGSVSGRIDIDPVDGRVALYGASNAVDRYLDIIRANGSTIGIQLHSNSTSLFTKPLNISDTTPASSSTVGALTIGNGTAATNVAIGGGNVNAGGTLTVGGAASVSGTSVTVINASNPTYNLWSNATPSKAGQMYLDTTGNATKVGYYNGSAWNYGLTVLASSTSLDGGPVTVTNSTPSTLTTNGALVVTGGVGVGGAMNVGGAVTAGGNVILNQGTYVLLNGAADLNSSLVRLAGNTILSAGGDVILKSSGATVLTGTSTGAATFAGAVNTGQLTITNTGANGLTVNNTAGNSLAIFNASAGAADANAYITLKTSGTDRWVFGQSVSTGAGDFEIYSAALGASPLKIAKATGAATFAGAVSLSTAGTTVSIKSGTNAAAGTVTLSGGAATITSTAIDVNTVIVMTIKTKSGSFDHAPSVEVAAGSATIDGHNSDNSTYNWVALKVN